MTDDGTRIGILPFHGTIITGKGTGLDLSTVYGIIKIFGGAVTSFSEPDQGTAFKNLSAGSHNKENKCVRKTSVIKLMEDRRES